MRLKNHKIHARANGNLRVEFARQNLTSYSGLELFNRYFRLIGLNFRIRRAFRDHKLSGDIIVNPNIPVTAVAEFDAEGTRGLLETWAKLSFDTPVKWKNTKRLFQNEAGAGTG